MDARHDLGEPLLGVLEGPGVAAGVLLHLQRGGGDAAGVGGLAGAEERRPASWKTATRLGRGGHVGALGDGDAAVA